MNLENWQKAKEIFNEALKLSTAEREKYLEQVAADNPTLGEQIRLLLESYESGFLEDTAVRHLAKIIDDNLKPGQQIDHYEIRELLGTGGMGEVYLADDTKLKRPVALKVLHPEVTADKNRIQRFIQEARAASALNHPNILTIYEIGTFEDSPFIVSEYVRGKTLRERLREKNLSLGESLEIALQIAIALEAAHEAGIIHRDIKPENIMLRQDGLVKVLDFGLAKLSASSASSDESIVDTEASTIAQVQTNPGMVMGTVAYMSPEQARGKEVDKRTDIWSLGVVVYEMLSGQPPFPGETTSDIIASILRSDAESFKNLDREIPREIEEICFKALEKESAKRYQTAQEFLQDLQRVKKHMENRNEQTMTEPFNYSGERNTELIRYRSTGSVEYIVTGVRRHKFISLGLLSLLTFFGIGVGVYKFTAVPRPEINAFAASQKLDITPLVTLGKVAAFPPSSTTISPDGKYAAYVATDGNKRSIRLRQIATTSDVEIIPPTEKALGGLSFSPDSNYLYYIQLGDDNTLFKVPTLGGASTKITGNIENNVALSSPAAVSPDGKTIAFCRDNNKDTSFIQTANSDGTNERTIIKFADPNRLYGTLAWSADGKTLAYAAGTKEKDILDIKLFGINVSDGLQHQLSESVWSVITRIVWLPDGNLIVSGKEKGDKRVSPGQLWLVAPNAPPQPITNDRYGYSGVSVTAKGDVLMALQSKAPRNLWIVPGNDTFQARQITLSGEIEGSVSWTPDGKILFGSTEGGNIDIWLMNADGTDRRQLTANQGHNGFASMTPDGRFIVFHSDREDFKRHVFRMDASGKNPKQLTFGPENVNPRVSRDGKWVYYLELATDPGAPDRYCKVSIDGGEPLVIATITDHGGLDVSPRSGMIAYVDGEDFWRKNGLAKIIIISPDDDKPVKTLLLPQTSGGSFIRWTPDERAIAFHDRRNERANIWTIPVDGNGEAKPLTNFTNEQMFHFDWSPDGKQLVAMRGTQTAEAVLITKAK